MDNFLKNELSGFGVWEMAYKITRARFLVLYLLSLLPVMLQSVPSIIWDENTIIEAFKVHPVILGLLFILSECLFAFFSIIIFYKINDFAREKSTSLKELLKIAVIKIFPFIALVLIQLIIILLGSIFLILPGIFLGWALFFSFMFLIFETNNPFTGIKRSFQIMWGNWWLSLVIYIIPLIIIFAVFVFAGIFLGVGIAFFHSSDESIKIMFGFFQIFLSPLFVIYFYGLQFTLWSNLKLKYAKKIEKIY